MSGIEKVGMKAKMSMDEMFSSKPVEILENQKAGKPDNQKDVKPASQKPLKPELRTRSKAAIKPAGQPDNQPAIQTSEQPAIQELENPVVEQKISLAAPLTPPAPVQAEPVIENHQISKIHRVKMTFNLTEDVYKAFNDLYARKILEGKPKEKSELISEAIKLLIQEEEAKKSGDYKG